MDTSVRYKQVELVLGVVFNIIIPLLFYVSGGPTFFSPSDILHFCIYSVVINLALPPILRKPVGRSRQLIGLLSTLLLGAYFFLKHQYDNITIYDDRTLFSHFILPILHIANAWLHVILMMQLLQSYFKALPASQAPQIWLRHGRLALVALPAITGAFLMGTRMLSYVSSLNAIMAFSMLAISGTIAHCRIGAYQKMNTLFLCILFGVVAVFSLFNITGNLAGLQLLAWSAGFNSLCFGYNAYCLVAIPVLYIWFLWYLQHVRKGGI